MESPGQKFFDRPFWIAQLMDNSKDEYHEEVKKISVTCTWMTDDTNVEKVKHLKETAIDTFQKADFKLHK